MLGVVGLQGILQLLQRLCNFASFCPNIKVISLFQFCCEFLCIRLAEEWYSRWDKAVDQILIKGFSRNSYYTKGKAKNTFTKETKCFHHAPACEKDVICPLARNVLIIVKSFGGGGWLHLLTPKRNWAELDPTNLYRFIINLMIVKQYVHIGFVRTWRGFISYLSISSSIVTLVHS